MRPGARGFLLVTIALVVVVLAFVAFTAVTEFWTLGQDDPISHFMHDMPKIGVFLFGFGVGGFGFSVLWAGISFAYHFWWAAKSSWKKQDVVIERLGDPYAVGLTTLRVHASTLWAIHTGGK